MSAEGEEARGGVRTRLGLLLGLLAAAALLAPQADRDVLVAQGVGRLLDADLEGAFGAGADASSIFASLDALVASGPTETLRLRAFVDDRPLDPTALDRAARAPLNRYAERRRPGAPPLRRSADAGDVEVDLAIATEGGRVSLGARLRRGGRELVVPRHGAWPLPGRTALLPPLLAVAVAVLLRRTLLALFVGIYAGAVVLAARSGSVWLAPLDGALDVFRVYLRRELLDTFRIEIVGFIVALIAMVGVMSRAGGVRGLVDHFLRYARSVRSALLLTWGLGLAIFFDDYANCVLVGNTMRPLTDRLRVSREKLAYVVDSTAAPVAGVSLFSTWIAFQVSVYSAQLPEVGIEASGYAVFVQSLPYRFYCWLSIFFVFLVIVTGRDFGPMARAERRARRLGQLVRPGARRPIGDAIARIEPAPGMVPDWRGAALPLVVTIAVTLLRIVADGGGFALLRREPGALFDLAAMTPVLLAGSGAAPIFAGALAGLLSAFFMAASNAARVSIALGALLAVAVGGPLAAALGAGPGSAVSRYGVPFALFGVGAGAAAAAARALRFGTARAHVPAADLLRSAASGSSTLAFALVLLFEAWMIGAVCRDLATADYLVALLSDALPPVLLPLLLFALACLVAFATGSSWSTMSILLPNVVGLAAALGEGTALGAAGMVVVCISAVLEGSIFGDHCSPISDTTVLSSVASGSDHLDHVRTQLPYALLVAAAVVLFGYLPLLFVPGWGPGLSLAAAALFLAAALWAFGRPQPVLAQGEIVQ